MLESLEATSPTYGLMMDTQLSIGSLIDHAARWHGDTEIVTEFADGSIHRYGYREARARSAQLAHALEALGIRAGDRVASFAWNSYRHFEMYFGVSGIGAILHTVNPRLFAQQIVYIVNHARDRFIFVDPELVPLLETLAPQLPHVERYVVLSSDAAMPATSLRGAVAYETLIARETGDIVWPQFDERTASSLCYTSGTTGNPKGVLYSHRSTLLHTYSAAADFSIGTASLSAILAIVPLFHANAWGLPYIAPMVGAKLVFPSPHLDPKALYALMESERVTFAAGVPTIWLRLLEYVQTSALRFSSLAVLGVGGSAPPPSLILAFERDLDVRVLNAWGMTETSPACTTGVPKPQHDVMPQRLAYKARAGRCKPGVELRLLGEGDTPLPFDGVATGELLVRGPWIASGYFEDAAATQAAVTPDGWLRTGDVASVDADGYVTIRDRAKDLIKSGGEWISSIELESIVAAHPDVAEVAAIAVPHPTWQERPLIVVLPKAGRTPDPAALLAMFEGKLAKWMIPDEVLLVDDIPHTATGKISKRTLRERILEKR